MKGRSAIFADCGLGKTLMQLEWARQVFIKTKKPVLILAPLAVAGQTIKEGDKFGINVEKYDAISPIQICNYEQLENIDCSIFAGIVLDESSILKNFEGQTKKLIIDSFKNTPYKLACTATPSPNDREVFQAVKMERKGIGFELKESYYDLAKANLKAAINEKAQVSLF
jgi:hypothetical protein